MLLVGFFMWWPRARRAPPPAAPVTRTMIVLPLIGDGEMLGRRITAQVESLLAQVPGVRVIPGQRLPRRPHTLSDLRNVGALINVGTVLYGELALTGPSMRVTLRLGELPDDSALWAGDFTRDTADASRLARAIADSVARTLHAMAGLVALSPNDGTDGFRTATERARVSAEFEREGKIVEALREARRAHELDPLARDIHQHYIGMLERAGRRSEAGMQQRQLRRITQYLESP